MVAALRRFADRGRTLACTIHQPRAETFRLFHQLLLVKAGETMYCGPVAQVPRPVYRTTHGTEPTLGGDGSDGTVPVDSQVPDFLRGCGVPCPPSVSPRRRGPSRHCVGTRLHGVSETRPPPGQVNPADVVVDLTHTKEADADEDGGEAVDLVARFAESDLRREMRRVPYLQGAEPSVGSVPWVVR